MALLKGMGNFFALDIGTNAIRVVQVSSLGPDIWSLRRYGYVPVEEKVTSSDSVEATHRLGEVIMTAVGQSGIKDKMLLSVYHQVKLLQQLSIYQLWVMLN